MNAETRGLNPNFNYSFCFAPLRLGGKPFLLPQRRKGAKRQRKPLKRRLISFRYAFIRGSKIQIYFACLLKALAEIEGILIIRFAFAEA